MKFIIGFKDGGFGEVTDYYLGKTYRSNGDVFPCFCNMDEAKRYSSRVRAEKAALSIGSNGGTPEVIEVSE